MNAKQFVYGNFPRPWPANFPEFSRRKRRRNEAWDNYADSKFSRFSLKTMRMKQSRDLIYRGRLKRSRTQKIAGQQRTLGPNNNLNEIQLCFMSRRIFANRPLAEDVMK